MLTALHTKSVITPTETIEDALVLIEDGVIKNVGARNALEVPDQARRVDESEKTAVPGFVDIHVHGGAGRDVMDPSDEALTTIATSLFRNGTLAFYPTSVSADRETTLRAVEHLGQAIRRFETGELKSASKEPLAIPLGIHLEGPFISKEKRGTHPAEQIIPPSKEFLNDLLDASDERIELLTVAPEVEGAVEFIRYARTLDLKIGIGHSNATFEEAERAIQAGATHATHLFNAMRPWHQREPGIVGATLGDPRLLCEVIADGVHVHPLNVRIAFQQKSVRGILGITDATSATAMPDGHYQLAGFEIEVRNGVCWGPGGMLAGSTLTQTRAIKNMTDWRCCTFSEAVQTASLNTAHLMGVDTHFGRIAAGTLARLNFYDGDSNFLEARVF